MKRKVRCSNYKHCNSLCPHKEIHDLPIDLMCLEVADSCGGICVDVKKERKC